MDPARPLSEMDTQYLGSTGEGTLRYMYLYVYIRVYRMCYNKEGGEKKKKEDKPEMLFSRLEFAPLFHIIVCFDTDCIDGR